MKGGLRAVALSVCLPFLLLTGASQAQTPPTAGTAAVQSSPQPKPITGFVSSYEIMRTLRTAGFDPLGPPLREGTTYVLRATDYRGILMHVVLDARTGAIRDVTRIVPEGSGPYGAVPPPYGPAPYPPPSGSTAYEPYGSSAEYEGPAPGSEPIGSGAPLQVGPATSAPRGTRPATSAVPASPPLPRPRPAALSAQAGSKQQPLPVTNAKDTTNAKTGSTKSASTKTAGPSAGVSSVRPAPSATPPLND